MPRLWFLTPESTLTWQLRLLTVSDASTGICLYKCTWNWRKNTNVDGVGSLVQSFFQFAREIGDGGERIVVLGAEAVIGYSDSPGRRVLGSAGGRDHLYFWWCGE
jgi:hypothetical protein